MKKRILLILMVLMMLFALVSCAAGTNDMAYDSMNKSEAKEEMDHDGAYDKEMPEADDMGNVLDTVATAVKNTSLSEKIIYSADVNLETVDFEGALEKLYSMIDQYRAFVESSNISGNSYRTEYYGHQSYRTANFVIRVPVEAYVDMTTALESVGNILNVYTYTDNITERFYDSQSRLDAYRIEEERLLSMLEKAETVPDMLDIESRLSQVRYEIEALESQLRNWQNQVDYSTITIYLREVEELSEPVEIHRTYWQEIGDGFKATLTSVGDFFKELFKGIIVAAPVLVILAVIAVVAIFVIRGIVRKKRAKKNISSENIDD